MRPCEKCDFIGPELPTVVRDERALHRAVHGFTDVFMVPLGDWQTRMLDRVMDARAKGLRPTLTLPRGRWRW